MIQFQVVFNTPQIIGDIEDFAAKLIRERTLEIEAEMKYLIADTPKTGRIYQRGAKTHQASARGEAPAIDSGDLINSILGRMTGKLQGEVNVSAEYSEYLEFGMNRPFVMPAIEAVLARAN